MTLLLRSAQYTKWSSMRAVDKRTSSRTAPTYSCFRTAATDSRPRWADALHQSPRRAAALHQSPYEERRRPVGC
jgi:hypothetical protein